MCIGIIYIYNIDETDTFEYFSESIIYTDNLIEKKNYIFNSNNLSKSALFYYHYNN